MTAKDDSRAGREALRAADPVFGRLIDRTEPVDLAVWRSGWALDPFRALARSVVGQQIAGPADDGGETMSRVATREPAPVVVQRISEQIQSDLVLMLKLKRTGIQPGREVMLVASDDGVRVTCGDSADGTGTELPREIAAHVFVSRP